MSVACPSCGVLNAYGNTECGGCRSVLASPVGEASGEPSCATHPANRAVATCARCGNFVCPECARAGEAGQAMCAGCFSREGHVPLPWDRRRELGTLRAFWRTSWETVVRPTQAFARANPDAPIGESLLFILLASTVGLAPTFLAYAVLIPAYRTLSDTGSDEGPPAALMIGIFAGYALFAPVASTVWTLVNAGLDHLVLRLLGERRGYEVTLRATALSMGPMIAGVVPVCSVYAVPIWSLVLRIFAYQGLHRTTAGRAAVGALASFAVCCGLGMATALLLPALLGDG